MAGRAVGLLALRRACANFHRTIATTSVCRSEGLSIADKRIAYPKLGDRDIVGYGLNGSAGYSDRIVVPHPAVRFKENTSDVLALREKEKGDWKNLSLEEKKQLYRASYCQTLTEITAPTGIWKTIMSGIFVTMGLAVWMMIYMKTFVYPPLPHTITKEWQEAMVERMVLQGSGHISGMASRFDYDKHEWKK